MLDWDDLRIFLAAAREPSFVAAGRRLGLDHTTLARRIAQLEEELGARLFDRSPRGISLTDPGLELEAHALRMEEAALAASGIAPEAGERITGTVRLAVPEAFGTYFFTPRIPRFRELHPGIELELVTASRLVSLSKREADIAIGLQRPEHGRLRMVKLSAYRLGVYAARELLRKSGPVDRVEVLQDQPFVSMTEELVDFAELRHLTRSLFERSVFRTSSVVAHMNAVSAGVGFGLLHCFAAASDDRLVRVLEQEVEVERSYWMVMHDDLAQIPRVRAVADFLIEEVRANRALL